MLCFGWRLFRPIVSSQAVLSSLKTKTNPNFSLIRRTMDRLIDEINSNHIKIIEKIRDLEQKIALEETKKKSKVVDQVVTEEQILKEKQRLTAENNELKQEVNRLIQTLDDLEAKRLPASALTCDSVSPPVVNGSQPVAEPKPIANTAKEDKKATEKGDKKAAKKEAKPKANKPAAEEEKPLDVSRIDLRVGRIVEAKRHPDADSLYVEQIDVGEDKPRTVISGLVKFVPIEEMQNRLVVVLCNLKPVKMRGINSEGMVMCASTPELVEILEPPEGSQPGDRVVFDKYPGTPDTQLNPKKKIWEQIAPDLKTDAQRVATYKGEPFKVDGKGTVVTKTLTNVAVK